MNPVVQATMQRMSSVATLPAIAMRIIKIAENPAATSDELHDVLSTDPALAARVLKVVNSAFYGRPRQVASTYAAIQLLGISAIRNVAIAASLTRMFRGSRSMAGFDATALWIHAVAVGATARRLAERVRGVPPEEAMLAGLLHDIGMLVSLQAWTPGFLAVAAAAAADPRLEFREIEKQIIGAEHQELGEALCESWYFPDALSRSCGHHHEPMELPEHQRRLPCLVHVADILAARAEYGFSRTVLSRDIQPDVLDVLGLSADDLATVELGMPEDFAQAMVLFAG